MKQLITIMAGIACLVAGETLTAGTDVKISGEVRWRSETDARSFSSKRIVYVHQDLRTRLQAEVVVDSNARAVVQLQDSRRVGGRNSVGYSVSGTTVDGKNVDLHQGYLELRNFPEENVYVRVGRFQVAFGNERLLGAEDWDNVGRSWEGALMWWDKSAFRLTAMGLIAQYDSARTCSGTPYERQRGYWGFYFQSKKYHSDVFALADLSEYSTGGGMSLTSMAIVGFYSQNRLGRWSYEANGVFHYSDDRYDVSAFGPAPHIRAGMLAAEIGRSFDSSGVTQIACGVDYTSGDNDSLDSKYTAYSNLFYSSHEFRGHMDYFAYTSSTRNRGLVDLMLRFKGNVARGWTLKSDLHYFQTAKSYQYAGAATSKLGSELDVVITTSRVRGASLEFGGGAFFASKEFAKLPKPEVGLWSYSSITVNF